MKKIKVYVGPRCDSEKGDVITFDYCGTPSLRYLLIDKQKCPIEGTIMLTAVRYTWMVQLQSWIKRLWKKALSKVIEPIKAI